MEIKRINIDYLYLERRKEKRREDKTREDKLSLYFKTKAIKRCRAEVT